MARMNVYVPDELAEQARAAGLNVSALTRAAITAQLASDAVDTWLDSLPTPPSQVTHQTALDALDAARAEFGADE
jgi:post-segregation antitoxin (ccd killing protein)